MKCPHCAVEVHTHVEYVALGEDAEGRWNVAKRTCPACNKFIIHLTNGRPLYAMTGSHVVRGMEDETISILVRPKNNSRPPCPPEVPKEIAEDYTEACLVLSDSPKASSAMSRRALQNILKDPNAGNAQQRDLADQIDHVLKSKTLPPYIANVLDAVRNIGNFGAHPMKSKATGEILPVEPGEAEWNLGSFRE
jgi:hypothetical protein